MQQPATQIPTICLNSFRCESCDFTCSYKKDWGRHIATRKHATKCASNHLATQNTQFYPPSLACACGKEYKDRTGLWRHRKVCDSMKPQAVYQAGTTETIPPSEEVKHLMQFFSTENIVDIIKQNQEFKELLMEQSKQNNEFQKKLLEQNKQIMELSSHTQKNSITNNVNYNSTINHNKFNLQVFLNEKCKDALNMSEFVNNLQITFDDLENVGTHGFVEGISRIFVKGLKELDVYKRPIHCSDFKRATMHVKDNNVWEKEDESRPKIIHAIRRIADKNMKTIPEWRNAYPDCRYSDSKKSDQYLNIVQKSVGACDKVKDEDNYSKILHKVAKEVVIGKDNEHSSL